MKKRSCYIVNAWLYKFLFPANLEKKAETCEDEKKEDLTTELDDLKSLLPDIQLKIQDAKESDETEVRQASSIFCNSMGFFVSAYLSRCS